MLSRKIITFNALSLVGAFALGAALFPYSAIPPEKSKARAQAQPVEEFTSISLGPEYGEVAVADLMTYYVENPPSNETNETQFPQKQHFGGC